MPKLLKAESQLRMLYNFFYNNIIAYMPDRVVEEMGEPFFRFASLFKNKHTETMPFNIGNLTFSNPVGMPAGWIDNVNKLEIVKRLGVGIAVIKTITPKAKSGNPYPRIVRKDNSMINSMGLPNKGVLWWADNYFPQEYFPSVISVKGDNVQEWNLLFEKLESKADIFELNLSCPNIEFGIMDLQSSVSLVNDISSITSKKLFIKLSPEFSAKQNMHFVDKIRDAISGVSAINTLPVTSPKLGNPLKQGGLSGDPIFPYLINHINELRKHYPTHSDLPIFASGGISSPEKAWYVLKKFKSIPLALTGFLVQGPAFYFSISEFFSSKLKDDKLSIHTLLN